MKKALLLLFSIFIAGCGSGGEAEVRTEFLPPANVPATEAGLIDLHGVETRSYSDSKVCEQYRVSISHSKDFEVDPGQRAALTKAIKAWNGYMDQELFVEVPTDVCVNRDVAATIVSNAAGLMNTISESQFRAEGTGVGDCVCIINADYDSAYYWNLWAHELGHCLGLGHATDERSIMYKYAKSYDFTTEMVDMVTEMQVKGRFGRQWLNKGCE